MPSNNHNTASSVKQNIKQNSKENFRQELATAFTLPPGNITCVNVPEDLWPKNCGMDPLSNPDLYGMVVHYLLEGGRVNCDWECVENGYQLQMTIYSAPR